MMDTRLNTSRPGPLLREVRQPAPRAVPAPGMAPEGEPVRKPHRRRVSGKWILLGLVALAALLGAYEWWRLSPAPLPPGIVTSNGRLEAIQIDIATKLAGRIEAVLVREGDLIESQQVLARMDTRVLKAQLQEAQAELARAHRAVATASAIVEQRRSELELAQSVLRRSQQLVEGHFISTEKLDTDQAQVRAVRATLAAALSQVAEAKAAVDAAVATIHRIEADMQDSVLRAPTAGRAQYRLAEPGEVLAAGGKVISMLDLSQVYMTVFLPEADAGKLAIGAEVRLVFDAAPQYIVPARVTFIASEAQFTPKTVETATERQKLVFRVKAQLEPELLRKYWTRVKAGVPGVAYVRLNPSTPWPQSLAVHLPPQ